MEFYCTAGRGTETFVAEELTHLFNDHIQITWREGKVFFNVHEDHIQDIKAKLLSLKTVERVFVQVLSEPVKCLDKRGLLTQLHTRIGNIKAWEGCRNTLTQLFATDSGVSSKIHDPSLEGRPAKRQKVQGNDDRVTTFRVSCKLAGYPKQKLHVQKTSMQMAVLISKLLGWKTDTRQPQYEVSIHMNDVSFTVGIPLTVKPLSKRVYIKHYGLRSTVAWIMIHLLNIRSGELILDPMCGCGTLLVEGTVKYKKSFFIGIDKSLQQLELASENLNFAQHITNVNLVQGDVTHIGLPDNSVDNVVTDAPFGINHTVDCDIEQFYTIFLLEVSRVLKPGGVMVLLTSRHLVEHVSTLCDKSSPGRLTDKSNKDCGNNSGQNDTARVGHMTDQINEISCLNRHSKGNDEMLKKSNTCDMDNALKEIEQCSTIDSPLESSTPEAAEDSILRKSCELNKREDGSTESFLDRIAHENNTKCFSLGKIFDVKLGETEGAILVLRNL